MTNETTSVKKGRDSYHSEKLHAKRDRKRQEAAARQREYDNLSLEDKINRATVRGIGNSKRELDRLNAQLQVARKKSKKA